MGQRYKERLSAERQERGESGVGGHAGLRARALASECAPPPLGRKNFSGRFITFMLNFDDMLSEVRRKTCCRKFHSSLQIL